MEICKHIAFFFPRAHRNVARQHGNQFLPPQFFLAAKAQPHVLLDLFENVARDAPVTEMLEPLGVNFRHHLYKLVFRLLRNDKLVLREKIEHNPCQFFRLVIGELDDGLEARGEARIRGNETLHFLGIASDDNRQPIAIISINFHNVATASGPKSCSPSFLAAKV